MPQIPDFHEVRFPTDIAFGSSGGPQRNTEIVTLGSGREQRNQRWSQSRRRFDAGYGIKDLDTLHTVVAFYEARRGPLFGFRFRDPLDWKSCPPMQTIHATDQTIGTGDGTLATFQLIKTYGKGDAPFVRPIKKPLPESVVIAFDGAVLAPEDFEANPQNGEITFTQPPPAGVTITAGYSFDVPVRFESDQLTVNLANFKAGDFPSIPLVEVRP